MAKPRVIVYDIETSNLGADMGFCLAVGWRDVGKSRVNCPTVMDFGSFEKDPTDDKELIQYACNELSKADILIGHYAPKFDFPFLQARLLYHHLPPMPPIPHVDTWWIARHKLRLQSNGLDNVARFFECKDHKPPLAKSLWRRAQAGHPGSIKYVKEHCVADVKVTEEVYHRLKSVHVTHPNINVVNDKGYACPVCASTNVQKQGFRIARVGKAQRWQCQDCGGWSQGASQKSGNIVLR